MNERLINHRNPTISGLLGTLRISTPSIPVFVMPGNEKSMLQNVFVQFGIPGCLKQRVGKENPETVQFRKWHRPVPRAWPSSSASRKELARLSTLKSLP